MLFVFLPVFGLISDSLMTISVKSHWCHLHQFILLTQGPIPEISQKHFENWVFWGQPFWNLKKKCLIPWKAVKGSWVARMGQNFDDYLGFQPMRSWANTYVLDCIKGFWTAVLKKERASPHISLRVDLAPIGSFMEKWLIPAKFLWNLTREISYIQKITSKFIIIYYTCCINSHGYKYSNKI